MDFTCVLGVVAVDDDDVAAATILALGQLDT